MKTTTTRSTILTHLGFLKMLLSALAAWLALPGLVLASHFSDTTVNYNGTLQNGQATAGFVVTSPLNEANWWKVSVVSGTLVSVTVTRTSDSLTPNLRFYQGTVAEGASPSGMTILATSASNSSNATATLSFTPNFTGQATLQISRWSTDFGNYSATITGVAGATPTVTTPTSTGITSTGATLGGNVTADGGATISERGVVYALTATNSNPQIGGTGVSKVTASGTTGVFTTAVSGLAPHAGYSFKAYATNSAGTTYTSVATFTTSNTNPTAPNGSTTGTTGDQTAVTVSFPTTDADGDTVSITAASSGTGVTVNSFTGTSVTFTPASSFTGNGSFTYTVGDGFGGSATGTVTVTVTDNDAPVITSVPTVPPVEATSAAGAVVTYSAATATDNIGLTSINYSTPSGTTFPIGTTTVDVTATDAANNTSATSSFTVTVRDTTGPVISGVPSNISAVATSASGAVVTYTTPTASDVVDGPVTVTCAPASGGTFAIGTTTVVCTATDAHNNTSTASFTVTVTNATPAISVDGAGVPALPKVLVIGATTYEQPVATNLANTGLFAVVDFFNGNAATPTLAQLNAYDSVLLTTNGYYQDAVAMGDVLADYLAAGHGVVTSSFAHSADLVTGRFVSDGYAALSGVRNGYTFGYTSLVTDVPADPIFTGVGAVSAFIHDGTLASGATQLAHFSDGRVAVAVKGRVVGLGFALFGSYASGDSIRLGANALIRAATSPGGGSAGEGTAFTQTGTFSDADGNATVTLTANSGTITQDNDTGTWSWTKTVDDGPASETITITATDVANATATASFTFNVTNVAPTGTITAPASADEDTVVSFTFTAADPSSADQAAGFAWSIDYGDGSTASAAAGTASPLARTHTFSNPGNYNVTFTATDKDGGTSTVASQSITIADTTAPVITTHPDVGPIEATSGAGAVVTYDPAVVTDNSGSVSSVTYSKPSGSTFGFGPTVVTITARDEAGHESTSTFTVTVRDTTPPEITSVPDDQVLEATSHSGAVATYGGATATDNSESQTITYSPPSGTTFDLGEHIITVTATDGSNNSSQRTFKVTVQDTTPPVISLNGGSTLTWIQGAPYTDGGATAVDIYDTSVTVVPSGTVDVKHIGSYVVSFDATDAHGNQATTVTRTVNVVRPETGVAVPGQTGLTFGTFGIPSIAAEGGLGFLTTMQPGNVTGIFAVSGIVAKKGAVSVKADGSVFTGRTYTGFTDPAMNSQGKVAFRATLNAGGEALFTNLGGTLRRVVALGDNAPDLGRVPPRFTTFTSFSLTDSALFFTSYLKLSSGFNSLWAWTPSGGLKLIAYEKMRIGGKEVLTFTALQSDVTSGGQGRGSVGGETIVQVRFRDGTQAVVSINTAGVPTILAESTPAGPLTSIFMPGYNSLHSYAFKANLKNPSASHGVASMDEAIFANLGGGNLQVLAEGGLLSNLYKIGSPNAPLLNASGSVLVQSPLFTKSGTVFSPQALLYKPFGASLGITARVGGDATGVSGAKWSAIKSIALPDGLGPVFLATMAVGQGGVTAADSVGLWAMDPTGTLRLVAREGQTLDGKTLRTMTVLSRVAPSPDQSRSFNATNELVYRAAFTDSTQAVVTLDLTPNGN